MYAVRTLASITSSQLASLLAGYTRRGLVGLQGTSAGGLLVAALLNRYVHCMRIAVQAVISCLFIFGCAPALGLQ